MEETLEELSRLLRVLYNIKFTYPRDFGGVYRNFYSYQLPIFSHNSNGYPIVEKLVGIEFQSTYSDARKGAVGFPNQFDAGNCVILEEDQVYFHRSMSETLFCYLGLLLREDLERAYEYFNNPVFLTNNLGATKEENQVVYSIMIQQQVWQDLQPLLTYPNHTFFFLYHLSQYAGFRSELTMEFKLDMLRRFIDVHLNDYNFDSLNEQLILD